MPVTPAGLEALPLKNLKDLVESSAAFSFWAAASGRVHYCGITVDGSHDRPYAIVGFVEDGFVLETNAGGASWHYGASGDLLLLFFADVDTATSIADQILSFANTTGAIIAQMAAAAGGSGALAVDRFERVEGPRLSDKDEHPDEPEYIVSVYVVSYGRGPTA